MDERASMRVVVDLELDGVLNARELKVWVYDLSAQGCMVQTDGDPLPAEGQPIHLAFPLDRRVSGKLVWAKGTVAGVQFTDALDQGTVARLGFKPPRAAFRAA